MTMKYQNGKNKILIAILLLGNLCMMSFVMASSLSADTRDAYISSIVDKYRDAEPGFSGDKWEQSFTKKLQQIDDGQIIQADQASTYKELFNIINSPSIDAPFAVSTSSMYYKSITPCRLADTRSGTSSGVIAANAQKSFATIAGSAITNQGGDSDCGAPATAAAVVINIASTAQSGSGHLRVFPYGEALPLAAILNYSAGVNIANSTILPICVGTCASSFSIYSGNSSSHVVVDIMGYFEPVNP